MYRKQKQSFNWAFSSFDLENLFISEFNEMTENIWNHKGLYTIWIHNLLIIIQHPQPLQQSHNYELQAQKTFQ